MKKDNFFKFNKSKKFSFDDISDVFDDMLLRSIPFYSEIQRMILDLTKRFIQPKSNLYDLGSSTGSTLTNIMKNIEIDDVNFIGMDVSESMLKELRLKLKKYKLENNCILLKHDLNNGVLIEDASVVIMNLTLQFIDPKNRINLLSNIYDGLRKNGCLILVEKIKFPCSLIEDMFTDFYYSYKKHKGYSDIEIIRKRELLSDILIPYSARKNISILKKSKFKLIFEFFRWYNFSGVVAIKT